MDEYNHGMDPEVKRYFKRIINSFSFASIWLLAVSTAGLFFRLAILKDGIRWYNILFYILVEMVAHHKHVEVLVYGVVGEWFCGICR